eukprot:m.34040 g.34040  ORF g.34040 m.34040 type:complete len:383 (+) comp16922_c0_seq1:469-1617(+)
MNMVYEIATTAAPHMEQEITSMIGYMAALVSILVWGSMFVFVKNPKVEAANADPVVSQLYSIVGVVTSSTVLLIIVPFKFSWWTTLAAALWVASNMLAFPIVRTIGIATGQGVWSGVIAVVSFIWAVLGQQLWSDPPSHCTLEKPVYAFGGIGLIVVGMAGLTYCSSRGDPNRQAAQLLKNKLSVAATKTTDYESDFDPLLVMDEPARETSEVREQSHAGKTILGVFLAVLMGVLGGSVLVPMKMSYNCHDFENGTLHGALMFTLSFAVSGAAITVALFFLRTISRGFSTPKMHLSVVGLPCFLQGALWNVGFVGSTIATTSPLGMSVGYPLTQCSILVGGLWGILYYKEIRGAKFLMLFIVSLAILGGGAIILGMGGDCAS